MSDHAPSGMSSRMRRFVAYSLLIHFGAASVWGVPAWIKRSADQDRTQEEAALAEHFRKEEAKTKEHVRKQLIEKTRREVLADLKREFDKLVAALADKRKEELWTAVQEKIKDESAHIAEALNNPRTTEQDLLTLEAELNQAMVTALEEELNASSARELADRFVNRVDNEVAPELAKWMQGEMKNLVAQKMREEAESAIAKQIEDDRRLREQTLAPLREAAGKADEANAAANQAAAQAPGDAQAAKQIEASGAQLGEAEAKLAQAAGHAAGLDAQSRNQVAAVGAAITAARGAVAKAASAMQSNSPEAAGAVNAAKDATAAVQNAARQAIDALAGASDRAAVASAAVRSASEKELSQQVEKTLSDNLTNVTLPRLSGQLQEVFKQQLSDAGLNDDALVGQVGQEVQTRLARSVFAQIKAGEQVQGKLGDVGSVGEGPAKTMSGDTALDKALGDALTGIGANADKRIGEMTANASQDSRLVGRVKGPGVDKGPGPEDADGDANGAGSGSGKGGRGPGRGDGDALADARAKVGAMKRGMRNGGGGGRGLGTGIGRGLGGHERDERAYAEVSGKIAGRDVVRGDRWARKGADGETSQAEETAGQVPAQVFGPLLSEAKPDLTNFQPYKPTFASIAFAIVPYFNGKFRIDGDLAKWDKIPALTLTPEYGPDRSPQVMKLAWSNAGLFMLFQITDPDHQLSKSEVGSFWRCDCVELWVDSFNTKEKTRARHAGQQFWLWPKGSASDPTQTGGESVKTSGDGGWDMHVVGADKLARWCVETPTGWTMEACLSAALLPDADLTPGRILGLNAYVTTAPNDPKEDTSITNWYWSAGKLVNTWNQPDTWGDLLLAGSDAKIEVIAVRGADNTKAIAVIGEPLHVRVTDGDMDLNPTARDKILITLKDSHGQQQIAVLEESGISTGIFDGAVSTALALDEPVPAVLSVFEGEKVNVSYLDQARANGARNAHVSTTVTFGAAVMAMVEPTRAP